MRGAAAHDRGLEFDLAVLWQRQRLWLPRRRMVQLLAGLPLFALAGCGSDNEPSPLGESSASTGDGTATSSKIFPSLAKATAAKNKVAMSQIALPEDACSLVYETSGYRASVGRFAQTSLTRDNFFGDDSAARQLGTVSGDVKSGMAVELPVTVKA